jgi:excisionase family DNA binding protein
MPHCRVPDIPLSERLGYDVGETAALINISVSFIYELIERGELETVKVAGRRIVPRWALEALLGCPIGAALANHKPPRAPIIDPVLPPVTTPRPERSRAPPLRRARPAACHVKQEEGGS